MLRARSASTLERPSVTFTARLRAACRAPARWISSGCPARYRHAAGKIPRQEDDEKAQGCPLWRGSRDAA